MSRYRRTDRGSLLPGVFAFASAVDSPTNTKLQLAALSKENFDRPHRDDCHCRVYGHCRRLPRKPQLAENRRHCRTDRLLHSDALRTVPPEEKALKHARSKVPSSGGTFFGYKKLPGNAGSFTFFTLFLESVIQAQTDGGRVIVAAEGVVRPTVGRELIGEAVAAAQFDPAKRFVVKRVHLAQTGNG